MRLSEMAKTPVRPRDFWIAVVIGILICCGIGIFSTPGERNTQANSWLLGSWLLLIWAIILFQVVRYGWRVFTLERAAILIGSTLFLGEKLWLHPPSPVSWASGFGCTIMIIGILLPYVDFKRPSNTSNTGPT